MKKPDTQLQAWEELQPTVSQKRLAVLKSINPVRGSTLFEISKKLNWPVNRVSGRVTELNALGFVYDSGERRLNPESNKNGIVWKTTKGEEQ